jgi:hypothetical protein
VRRAALAVVLLLAGCPPRLRPPPPGLPLDPAELLAAVRAAQVRVTAVQGTARLRVEGPDGEGGVDQFLAAERPGRLRVESQDFFGNVVSILAVDGEALALYDARARILYRGPASPENVARLVRVALPPADLVALLCGSVALLDGEPVDAAPADGALRLTLRRGEAQQVLDVGAGAAVLRSDLRRAGVSVLEAGLSGHRLRGGLPMPTEVTLRAPHAGLSLDLRWKELEVNARLDPKLFRLEAPAGAKVMELEGPIPAPSR